MTARDLTGRMVRTVVWQDGIRRVSEPMRVVAHVTMCGRAVVRLRRRDATLLHAYVCECELLGEVAT